MIGIRVNTLFYRGEFLYFKTDFCCFRKRYSCVLSPPVEGSFQHSFNYSICSFAWLRLAGLHATSRIRSHVTAFICHRVIWSPISSSAAAHWSPISYTKGGRSGTLFTPQTPVPSPHLVGCLASNDHQSASLAASIVNHPQWHYWSVRWSVRPLVHSVAPGQHCSQAVAYWSPSDTVLRSLYW